ncbi:enoyl-CoA hydratase/isomerase family protein [Nocardia sp. NPDC057030]|uniref:enoyl-CoA hydratase/isomerase family protein n=1 Tax=unclassified Nocardia TaxID=2637762 RepID=UPI00362FE077
MTQRTVLCELVDGVGVLTLNRPEKLNAINAPMLTELRQYLTDLAADATIRCLIVTGSGGSFCAGADLESDLEPGTVGHAAEVFDLLEDFPAPTIGKLRGNCLTGGLELALCCDLLVAATSVRIADTHSRWGLVPAGGMTVRLAERIGVSSAKRLAFTAEAVDGAHGWAIGLVDLCVADDELDREVERLVSLICANSLGSHRIYKSLLRHHRGTQRTAALLFERSLPFGFADDVGERIGKRP